jgi:hypothetical protein
MGQQPRQPRVSADEAAERQSLFRDLNERIRELGERFDLPDEPVEVVCECGHRDCRETIALSATEYELVRQSPARFVVLRGHEMESVEHVVADKGEYLIVEKVGKGGRIATERESRRNGRPE